jgi:hypothetical protein
MTDEDVYPEGPQKGYVYPKGQQRGGDGDEYQFYFWVTVFFTVPLVIGLLIGTAVTSFFWWLS